MKIESRPELRAYVETKVAEDWSPEEVSGRIKEIERPIPYVSAKAIYKYIASIYGRRLEQRLAYK